MNSADKFDRKRMTLIRPPGSKNPKVKGTLVALIAALLAGKYFSTDSTVADLNQSTVTNTSIQQSEFNNQPPQTNDVNEELTKQEQSPQNQTLPSGSSNLESTTTNAVNDTSVPTSNVSSQVSYSDIATGSFFQDYLNYEETLQGNQTPFLSTEYPVIPQYIKDAGRDFMDMIQAVIPSPKQMDVIIGRRHLPTYDQVQALQRRYDYMNDEYCNYGCQMVKIELLDYLTTLSRRCEVAGDAVLYPIIRSVKRIAPEDLDFGQIAQQLIEISTSKMDEITTKLIPELSAATELFQMQPVLAQISELLLLTTILASAIKVVALIGSIVRPKSDDQENSKPSSRGTDYTKNLSTVPPLTINCNDTECFETNIGGNGETSIKSAWSQYHDADQEEIAGWENIYPVPDNNSTDGKNALITSWISANPNAYIFSEPRVASYTSANEGQPDEHRDESIKPKNMYPFKDNNSADGTSSSVTNSSENLDETDDSNPNNDLQTETGGKGAGSEEDKSESGEVNPDREINQVPRNLTQIQENNEETDSGEEYESERDSSSSSEEEEEQTNSDNELGSNDHDSPENLTPTSET